MGKPRPRPGLAKARQPPLLKRRELVLWHGSDYRWRELFEAADVLSEGATRKSADEATYYGSTSIVMCPEVPVGAPALTQRELASLMAADPHVRLRAVRIACREAQVRAKAPMGKIHAEVAVKPDVIGVRIHIEVQASVPKDSEIPSLRVQGRKK
jgi:hypothetical protein